MKAPKTYLEAIEVAETMRQKELPAVIERIKSVYKLSTDELVAFIKASASLPAQGAKTPRKRAAKKPAAKKPAKKHLRLIRGGKKKPAPTTRRAKYRDEATGETWTGSGRMARWLKAKQDAGEDIERYRVTVAASA